MTDKRLQIGFNTFDTDILEHRPDFEKLLLYGADYVFCHTSPDPCGFADDCEKAAALAAALKEKGLPFIANFEFQNFAKQTVSPDGFDWSNRENGTHLLNLRPAFVQALAAEGNLIGITYDEFEHVIINRNISLWLDSKGRIDKAAFPQLATRDAFRQGEALAGQLGAYAESVRALGAPVFSGEHVFPVLYHIFARSGVIPNFKSQKECYSNLQFAVAAGAALEYGTPLWNCVDMWHKLTNPGHSATEMYHNLLFAYLAGVNRVYVESAHALVADGAPNENGREYLRFVKEYRGRQRDYDICDYRPEIGIIRYDDAYWGQNLVWARGLFGNKMIKPDRRNREWIGIIRTLTFGETGEETFTWNRIAPSSLKKHRSFCSMNALAVFDDRVGKQTLSTLKLAFLCGVRISPETLADVQTLVAENGLTAVCPTRFLPGRLRTAVKGSYTEIPDGSGLWIVTDDFGSARLKKRIAPFLGCKGEIRLPFADREIRLQLGADGETFTVNGSRPTDN